MSWDVIEMDRRGRVWRMVLGAMRACGVKTQSGEGSFDEIHAEIEANHRALAAADRKLREQTT